MASPRGRATGAGVAAGGVAWGRHLPIARVACSTSASVFSSGFPESSCSTKLDVVPQSLVSSMLGIRFHDFAYLPASSTRGGILIAGRQPDQM